MNRALSLMTRVSPVLLALSLFLPVSRAQAAVTTYADPESFLTAAGSGLTREEFDSFTSGTLIDDQIPGVVFYSPNGSIEGFTPIKVLSHSAAFSEPNMLVGGSVPGNSETSQIIDMRFYPAIDAFALYLTAYDPAATPATVFFEFGDESYVTAEISNGTGNESTPVFFGAIGDRPIVRIVLTSGTQGGGFEEFGLDDLQYRAEAEGDTTPPVCAGGPATVAGILGIDGTVTESSPCIDCLAFIPGSVHLSQSQTGIVTVELEPGSSNVTLTVESFDPGASLVSFRVEPDDPGADGEGTVIATDGAGNTCTLPTTFRALGPGPLSNETLCTAEGLLFSVGNEGGTPAGAAVCSVNLPTGGEIFPPGYEPSPADDPSPCRILTIESPVSGSTDMILKKDGTFDARLRMLYAHGTESGGVVTYDPFADVTLSVDPIDQVVPDPTRVSGSAQWSPVKVTCAIQTEESRLSYCAGLSGAAGPDADADGFSLCGSSTSAADCNDQRSFINPGTTEKCNGLDDDCDGAIDDGHPTEGAGRSCTVVRDPALLGACLQGATSCADAPMTCEQTVFPVPEIACNGVDDDCDGLVDETFAFSYLAPIKPSGTPTIFKKRGAIPVKFELRDCAGRAVTSAVATIEVHFVAQGQIVDDALDIASVGQANVDNFYRVSGSQYIYNLNASFLQSSSFYVIRTRLDDGTVHDVTIGIK